MITSTIRDVPAQWSPGRLPRHSGSKWAALAGVTETWVGSIHTVMVAPIATEWGEVLHLFVRRHDSKAERSWPTLQRIKNELVGPERVAVEVFPAASQLVDEANMYHLWVLPDGMKLPFGLVRSEP